MLACMIYSCFSEDLHKSGSTRAFFQSGCWKTPHSIPVAQAVSVELETGSILTCFPVFPSLKHSYHSLLIPCAILSIDSKDKGEVLDWGENSVSNVLALQAQRPNFSPQKPCKAAWYGGLYL